MGRYPILSFLIYVRSTFRFSSVHVLLGSNTDRNIFDDSYQSVTYILDFQLWENGIAYFKQKLLLKVSNSVLPDREIRKMCYLLVGIVRNIFISIRIQIGQTPFVAGISIDDFRPNYCHSHHQLNSARKVQGLDLKNRVYNPR